MAEKAKEHQSLLDALRQSARLQSARQNQPDSEWIDAVSEHVHELANRRIQHVADWIAVNTVRFANSADTLKLRRIFESAVIDLNAGLEFCRAKCLECNLLCVLPKRHDGPHECKTTHICKHRCEHLEGHDEQEPCGLP